MNSLKEIFISISKFPFLNVDFASISTARGIPLANVCITIFG